MVDFGRLAKKAQDALAQGSDKIEAALKDNAGKIEGAVDKAGQFAKEKMPDRAAQIDNATQKAKAAVPRHEDGTGTGTASRISRTRSVATTPRTCASGDSSSRCVNTASARALRSSGTT